VRPGGLQGSVLRKITAGSVANGTWPYHALSVEVRVRIPPRWSGNPESEARETACRTRNQKLY
jgi:hypothetical protein